MLTNLLDGTPPHSIEAEQATLGAMLIEKQAVETVSAILGKEAFYRENHQILFDVITFLVNQNEPIDLITVPNELTNRNQLDTIGGMAYLAALFDTVPTATNVEYYAQIVAGLFRRRQIMADAATLFNSAGDTDKDVGKLLAQTGKRLLALDPKPVTWEVPAPFAAHSLPPFPIEALPSALADFVSEVAASVQVPVDLPAMLGLGVLGAAAARTCRVQIGQTHSEPMNLYVAVFMEPGERKSQVMEAMAAPLRAAERDMVTEAMPEIERAHDQQKIGEKRLAHLHDIAAKGKPADAEKARTEIAEMRAGPSDVVPATPRLLVDDVTPEKMAELMAEQDGTLVLASAEGGIFGILAGRYSDGKANLDLFLKGHAGEEYRVDRKAGASVFIPSACLSLLLAVQPSILTSLADSPDFRGRGLLGRFLYCLPESKIGTRFYQDRPINADARRRYEVAVKALLNIPRLPESGQRHSLQIEGEALAGWIEFADWVEQQQAEGQDLAGIRDWASKLAGAVARIAGGLHLVENMGRDCPWNIPISAKTVAAAWAIGEYLISHAQAAYGRMGGDPNAALAQRLLRWIERSTDTEFTLSQCHQAHRSAGTPKDLEPALTLLCERGFLRQKQALSQLGKGRPKSPTYEINPAAKNTVNTK